MILPDGKVPRLPLCQIVKQIINLVAEVLVVLPHLHLIQHVDQRRKVLPFRQQLVMDVANQGDIQQRFGLDPEIISGFAFTLRVGNQCRDELQNVLFAVNVRERVVVHRLLEVDGVENTQIVPGSDQHLAAFHDKGSLRISHHQRGAFGFGALHDVGLHEEPCFAAAGAADDEHVFVARILRVLGAAVHRQALSFREDHVVPRVRVDERLNIAGLAP